jgi:hypothetical protein
MCSFSSTQSLPRFQVSGSGGRGKTSLLTFNWVIFPPNKAPSLSQLEPITHHSGLCLKPQAENEQRSRWVSGSGRDPGKVVSRAGRQQPLGSHPSGGRVALCPQTCYNGSQLHINSAWTLRPKASGPEAR